MGRSFDKKSQKCQKYKVTYESSNVEQIFLLKTSRNKYLSETNNALFMGN